MNALKNNKNGNIIFISTIVGGLKRAQKLAQSEYYDLVNIDEPKPKEEIPILEAPKRKGRKPKSEN